MCLNFRACSMADVFLSMTTGRKHGQIRLPCGASSRLERAMTANQPRVQHLADDKCRQASPAQLDQDRSTYSGTRQLQRRWATVLYLQAAAPTAGTQVALPRGPYLP